MEKMTSFSCIIPLRRLELHNGTIVINEEGSKQKNNTSSPSVVNLCTRDDDSSNASPAAICYVPKTFGYDLGHVRCRNRRMLLPGFPTSFHDDDHVHLLLANVPGMRGNHYTQNRVKTNRQFICIVEHRLTVEEKARRHSGAFRKPFDLIHVNNDVPSFFFDEYRRLLDIWTDLWRVDLSILNYNYVRLRRCIDALVNEQIIQYKLRPNEVKRLQESEYPIALEFYLQIDGKLCLCCKKIENHCRE